MKQYDQLYGELISIRTKLDEVSREADMALASATCSREVIELMQSVSKFCTDKCTVNKLDIAISKVANDAGFLNLMKTQFHVAFYWSNPWGNADHVERLQKIIRKRQLSRTKVLIVANTTPRKTRSDEAKDSSGSSGTLNAEQEAVPYLADVLLSYQRADHFFAIRHQPVDVAGRTAAVLFQLLHPAPADRRQGGFRTGKEGIGHERPRKEGLRLIPQQCAASRTIRVKGRGDSARSRRRNPVGRRVFMILSSHTECLGTIQEANISPTRSKVNAIKSPTMANKGAQHMETEEGSAGSKHLLIKEQ